MTGMTATTRISVTAAESGGLAFRLDDEERSLTRALGAPAILVYATLQCNIVYP